MGNCFVRKQAGDRGEFFSPILCGVEVFYKFKRELDVGATSVVVQGESSEITDRLVAIKRVRDDLFCPTSTQSNSSCVIPVKFEADLLRNLHHPNVIQLHEAFESVAGIDMVLEWCAGGNLLSLVNSGIPIPAQVENFAFRQMLHAVSFLHSRLVCHKDIKPENWLFVKPIDWEKKTTTMEIWLKLCDFGSAKQLSRLEPGTTETDPRRSSLAYVAPEILHPAGTGASVNSRLKADIWSLGCVLYVLLLQQSPFRPRPHLSSKEVQDNILAFRYEQGEKWDKMDARRKTLIRRMFEPEATRPMANELWNDAWVRDEYAGAIPDKSNLCCKRIFRGVMALGKLDFVQHFVLTVWAQVNADWSLPDIEDWRHVFEYLAYNYGDAAPKAEQHIAMREEIPLKAAERFAALCMRHEEEVLDTQKRVIISAFKAMDINRSGSIDWLEWICAAHCVDVPKNIDTSDLWSKHSILYRNMLGYGALIDQGRMMRWCLLNNISFDIKVFEKWKNPEGVIDPPRALKIIRSCWGETVELPAESYQENYVSGNHGSRRTKNAVARNGTASVPVGDHRETGRKPAHLLGSSGSPCPEPHLGGPAQEDDDTKKIPRGEMNEDGDMRSGNASHILETRI